MHDAWIPFIFWALYGWWSTSLALTWRQLLCSMPSSSFLVVASQNLLFSFHLCFLWNESPPHSFSTSSWKSRVLGFSCSIVLKTCDSIVPPSLQLNPDQTITLFFLLSLAQSRVKNKQFKFGVGGHPGPELCPTFCQILFLILIFSSTDFHKDICHLSTSSPPKSPKMIWGLWGVCLLDWGPNGGREIWLRSQQSGKE